MAFIRANREFDMDNNGMLQSSLSRTGLIIDEDGIVRDDDLEIYRDMVQGRWTDSGIGGDKQSSSSTLHHRQNSFDDDLAPVADESINISEFEASKDDLSFDRQDDKYNGNIPKQGSQPGSLQFLESREITPDTTLNNNNELSTRHGQKHQLGNNFSADFGKRQIFSEDYYRQLRDLGVLVDGVDLSRDSLTEFEDTELHASSRMDEYGDGRIKDSQDLIGEYLKSEIRKEREENEIGGSMEDREVSRRGSGLRGRESGDRFSLASSRTISNYSFPDEDDDDGRSRLQNLDREDHFQGQRLGREHDDNSFNNITGRILPTLSGRDERQGRAQGGFDDSRSSTPGGQNHIFRGTNSQALGSLTNPGTHRIDDSDNARAVHTVSRPSSRSSHISTASDVAPARQKTAEVGTTRLVKSNSQNSFFEEEQVPHLSGGRTHHKRILPKLGGADSNQSFKVKGKSANNNLKMTGHVKPSNKSKVTRLSDMEYEGDTITGEETFGDLSGYVEESAKELSDRLTQEAQKRKQATELVQQLQKDYGSLLNKYALAELTIDQMRLGAKITLHADSPTPSQAQSGVMSPASGQQAQVRSLQQSPSQGILMTSSATGLMGAPISTSTDGKDQGLGRSLPMPGDQRSRSRPDLLRGSLPSLLQTLTDSHDGNEKLSETGVETIKAGLLLQVQDMEDRLESFSVLMAGGQLTLVKQEAMFDQIKGDHDKIRRAYLQVKDEYNVLRRSGALTSDSQNFDHNKELEGNLFRLGMRFDEVHERVDNNLKERSAQRQPFQADNNYNNNQADGAENRKDTSHRNDVPGDHRDNSVTDNHQTSDIGDIAHSRDSEVSRFEQRVRQLREEYNSNMDLYRKLKYPSNTLGGEREIEHIVLRLSAICTEMPDMFRLSPEIQARWEKLSKREQEMKQQRQSPVSENLRGNNSSDPLNQRSPIILRSGSNSSDQDSLRARSDGSSRSSLNSILPDRMDQVVHQNNNMRDHSPPHNGIDRPSSRSSNFSTHPDRPPSRSRTAGADHSFADSLSRSHDHDTSSRSLPRPRRHEHGVRDPRTLQMSEASGGLPHGTRSDQDNHGTVITANRGHHQDSHGGSVIGTTGSHDSHDNMEGALAALPGPGKMKQMTKQRAGDDADSGFIGSMVGSGVGVPPAQEQLQQQEQQHRTLRLAGTADESSTLSDQSLDASSTTAEKPRTLQARVKTDKTQKRPRGQQGLSEDSSHSGREESYDGEGDTTATLESDVSLRRGEDGHRKSQRPVKEGRNRTSQSQDATLEEIYTDESETSTPRAANQSQQKPITKGTTGSYQNLANQKTQTKPHKSSSQGQPGGETEDEIRSADTSKAQHNRSEISQTSEREGEAKHKRLKSPPPPHRPPSRGSPTSDLFHTRERRASGGGRPASRSLTESGRQKHEQPGPQLEAQRYRDRKGVDMGHGVPSGLSLGPQSSNISGLVKEYEERSTGSDVEFGSSVTRASSVASSNRLKALQEEIEKLKEGVARANERAGQPLPPQMYHIPAPAPPAQPQRQEPEYFDPFDDPYGFMKMPRRRANSFSGGREREWDEWYWTLPQNRQYDGGDIPLGYAAADAYAELPLNGVAPRQHGSTRDGVKNRIRQRRMEHRRQRNIQLEETEPGLVGGYSSANQQPHLSANQQQAGTGLPNEHKAAVFEYYVPSRYSATSMRQQMTSQGYFTTPGGAKIYSSTGDEGDNEEERDVVGPSAMNGPAQSRPWYQIRRTPRPLPSHAYRGTFVQAGGGRRTQSQEDISHWGQPGTRYNIPGRGQARLAVGPRAATRLCPMCGGMGNHTHTNHTPMGQPYLQTPPAEYSVSRESSPARQSRRRSRSPSLATHYTTERPRSQSRYRVREYSRLSDTDDEEERTSRRSRSLSRGRSRTQSRGRSEDRHYRQRSDSPSDRSSIETNLDRSLSLSVDIGRLTQKMLGTVSSQLKRSKDKQEFGSSFW